MTSTEIYRLETAIDCLNNLISEGYELPEAISKTIEAFAVSQRKLTEFYDAQ